MQSVLTRRSRKPPSSIESMLIHNRVDEMERWIPLVIRKGSWITMQQNKRRKTNPSISHFINAWKGKVKQFKLENGKKMVLVQHVFMHREIQLQSGTSLPRHRPNCKFL